MIKPKKIVLFKPYNEVPSDSLRRLLTPLGLLYIASILEKDYKVTVIDSQCEGYDNTVEKDGYIRYGLSDKQVIERIKKENPDFICIGVSFSDQEKIIISTCKVLRKAKPNAVIILGGVHPTFFPKRMLEICPEVDFVVIGEGEYRTKRLIDTLTKNKSYESYEGLAFRKNKGGIVVNASEGIIKDLDKLPFPTRHLIDMEKYISVNIGLSPYPRKERVAQILTSRGCPFHCNFCSSTGFLGHKFRQRSVSNVIDEIKFLKGKYNIQEIQFTDDNISLDRNWIMKLCKRMKGLNLVWCTPTGIMMKTLDEEVIKLMAESGCYQLTFSIESANQRVLDHIIHKPLNLRIVKPLIDIAHKYGISIHTNNIIGMPSETRKEMMKTFEFNKEVGADSAAFFIPTPLPNSELYKQCIERGWIETQGKLDLKCVSIRIKKTEPEYIMPPEELEELVERKTREHNEWSKKNNPEMWKKKFSQFLKTHKSQEDKIMGRVT